MDKLGTNIRKIRQQRGFSQDYMATQLDVAQATYARWENEETRITVDKLHEIAKVLNTDISDFFNDKKFSIQTINNNEGAFSGYIHNLTVENRETTNKLIESYNIRLQEKDEQINFLKELLRSKGGL